jgi:hypothetical protein
MEIEMRRSSCHITIESVLSFCLVLFAHPGSQAEPVCPGNAASITPRYVQRTLIILPVKVNGQGPFDFIVDTGSQHIVVDPALAIQLMLKFEGTIGLATVAGRVSAPMAEVASVEADTHIVEKTLVVVEDLGQLQAVDRHIRGILGENFLAHFDVFIDYRHKMLCMDDTRQMRQSMRGEHISLVEPQGSAVGLSRAPQLFISVQVSNARGRRLLLRLDSGTNAPMLFGGIPETPEWMRKRLKHNGRLVGRAEQAFDLLPPADLRIGSRTLHQVSFVTPIKRASSGPGYEQDGLLPTVLFHCVFISFTDRLVILDPN